MMPLENDSNFTSPSLVELAVHIRSEFKKQSANLSPSNQKVIVKAQDMARIYCYNNEKFIASELDVLYEILREFGVIAAHVPQDFHVHVSNVIKCLQMGDKTVTKSHVAGLIFSRM
jgi:ribosome-interacting GTPase 1